MTDAQDLTIQLQQTTAAVRLKHEKLGVTRSLEQAQLNAAASCFGADPQLMRAGKKLFDTAHPAYKAVTGVRSAATKYWQSVTIPYPENGIRLIKRSAVQGFEVRMKDLQHELSQAVAELQSEYAELVSAARVRLGDLFCPSDYPDRIDTQFSLDWDYPSFEPPEYLKQISPALYDQERDRVTAKFQEAVSLTEQAFIAELSKVLSHLVERLTGDNDGKPKIFRDTALTNLQDFFAKFSDLNVGNNEQLDTLVSQAQQLAGNVAPDDLRSNLELRAHVANKLTEVQQITDAMMVDKPKRAFSFDEEGGAA